MCYYYQHDCLLVCLSLLFACLSVKLQWMILRVLGVLCVITLFMTQVSVKVIPKSFDTCLNSA